MGSAMTDAAASTDPVAESEYCPFFQHAVELIGRRWTGSILKLLTAQSLRFGELRNGIPGLSDRLLATRLAELETEGVVVRTDVDGDVRYSLSPKGVDLGPVFDAIASWSHAHHDGDFADAPGRRRC